MKARLEALVEVAVRVAQTEHMAVFFAHLAVSRHIRLFIGSDVVSTVKTEHNKTTKTTNDQNKT